MIRNGPFYTESCIVDTVNNVDILKTPGFYELSNGSPDEPSLNCLFRQQDSAKCGAVNCV